MAGHVACGQTVVVNTVLDSNVGPCATGIKVGADNITLDLNGFTVSGTANTGDGAGIEVAGRTGVTVRNGTVTGFDAGVALIGGSRNRVTAMRVIDDRGDFASDFGDGIALFNSNDNVIDNNEVTNNGPYSGIGLITSNRNVLDSNRITGNNQSATNTAGIRLENARFIASNDNVVTNNLVTTSGTFGIQVFAGGSRNVIRNNQSHLNRLDGITVFAGGNSNVIAANLTRSNGGSGVYVRGAAGSFPAPANNQVLANVSGGNAQFDLRDGTPNCGSNVWSGNQGATATPPCTLNP